MGYHRDFSSGTADALEGLLKTSRDADCLRRAQAVYFRAKYGYPVSQIARMTGYSEGTVRNLHSAYFRGGMAIFNPGRRGGRNAAYLTPSAEEVFLCPFFERGDAGGILEIGPIHEAHCEALGRKIPLSTTYRLLHRHGWRKIEPRPRHPKADKEAQAAFKKMA